MHPPDDLMLGLETAGGAAAAPRLVRRPDESLRADPYTNADAGVRVSEAADPDRLFGASVAYQKYAREKPEHRRMLWFRLQGYNVKETAALTGYTPQTVSQVCKQPWFIEAFCRLSTEMGKDTIQTFLEGEVMPALVRVVDLAQTGGTDAVRLAANKEIVDRFLGKATVRVETKVSGQIDNVVFDAAALLEEQRRNAEILKSRGIGAK